MFTKEGGLQELQLGVREVCGQFPNDCWWDMGARREYPEEFGREMASSGLPRSF